MDNDNITSVMIRHQLRGSETFTGTQLMLLATTNTQSSVQSTKLMTQTTFWLWNVLTAWNLNIYKRDISWTTSKNYTSKTLKLNHKFLLVHSDLWLESITNGLVLKKKSHHSIWPQLVSLYAKFANSDCLYSLCWHQRIRDFFGNALYKFTFYFYLLLLLHTSSSSSHSQLGPSRLSTMAL